MHEKILTLAQSITGAKDSETLLLDQLCTAAADNWEGRLRPGVMPSDCEEAFTCAAAFTAAAGLLTGRGSGETVSSFSAGSVSVRSRAAAETDTTAGALREQAERLMAPYVEDARFSFRGVRG